MSRLLLTALLAIATATMQTSSTTQSAASAEAGTVSPAASSKPASGSVAEKPPASAAVNPTDAVITIHGVCSATGSTKAAECTTVVTKKDFDGVVDGLNAIGKPLLPIQLRGVAEGYASTLINYERAKKAGVERDPRFAEVMRLARIRAMGDMYNALQQEKAMKVSPDEIQTYYKGNLDKLEELTMRRVTLPRFNMANLKDEEFAAKARKLADEIHARLEKGEDLDQLQKEAFDAMGVKDPPRTKMGPVRRGLYEAEQEKQLFALKPGEITPVMEQPSAFIIFKLEGRETPSLEKAKDEIVRILIKQHMEKQQQAGDRAIKIDYNEKYVGSAQPSAWMPASQLNAKDGQGKNDPKAQSGKSQQK